MNFKPVAMRVGPSSSPAISSNSGSNVTRLFPCLHMVVIVRARVGQNLSK